MTQSITADKTSISVEEFVRRLRRYPRDQLLQSIARVNARAPADSPTPPDQPDAQALKDIREAYLCQIAALCLACCNNYRRTEPSQAVVDWLVNSLHVTRGPWFENPLDTNAWQQTLSRIAYSQLASQQDVPDSWVRSYLLFGDDPAYGEPVFRYPQLQERIGATFSDLLRVGFLLYAFTQQFKGVFTKEVFRRGDLLDLFVGDMDFRSVTRILDRWFAKPINQLAIEARECYESSKDIWGFNPLVDRPIASMNDGRYVIPSPRAIMNRISPQGLYFIARDAIDADSDADAFQAFTSSLGKRFERYIGEQLNQLEFASVRPEITYDSSQQSVDYLVETPELIVLVEAKSAAPDANTRSGFFPIRGDIQRKLQRACGQIGRSAELIRVGHPKFPSLNNREVRGLVITREQYFNLPMPSISDLVNPVQVPTNIVSSQQFERALGRLIRDPSIGHTLLGAFATDTNTAKYDLIPISQSTNPLLAKSFREWNPFGISDDEFPED